MEQIMFTLATIQAAKAKCFMDNSHFSDISYNITTILNSFKWPFNTSLSADLQIVRLKGNDKTAGTNSEATTHSYNNTTGNYLEAYNADSLSIMWYLASFGALVMFFLLISFSEVCCKKSFIVPEESQPEVSPPPYDLFAPPAYDSLYNEQKEKSHKIKKKKLKCEVFVIPMFRNKITGQVINTEIAQTHNTNIDQSSL